MAARPLPLNVYISGQVVRVALVAVDQFGSRPLAAASVFQSVAGLVTIRPMDAAGIFPMSVKQSPQCMSSQAQSARSSASDPAASKSRSSSFTFTRAISE